MAMAGSPTGAARSGDRWWRSLAARATLTVGALLAALSVLLIATNAESVRRSAERAIERQVAGETAELAASLEDADLSWRRLTDLMVGEGLAYAYVETADGKVIAGAAPTIAPPVMSPAGLGDARELELALVASAGGVAHAAKSIRRADGGAAVLRAGMTLSPAKAAGRDAAVQGLMAALAFLALALPALALTVDRAASPLRALTRAVTQPGTAGDAVRSAGARQDEVGALARAHLAIARDLAHNADELHRLTFDDPLTRLPNGASLTGRLATALQLGQQLALMKIEVAGLSRVAAGLGPHYGDEAVRRAADRLSEMAADWARDLGLPGDQPLLLARISDTGFGLLARGAEACAAKSLADAAVAAFEAPLFVGEYHVTVAIAVGVALAPDDGDEAGAILRSASAAVSAARAAGPQSVRFAGAELTRMAYGRLKLEQDLRRAIDAGELELHYQPQISLKAGGVSGAEALVRWRHPIRGLVPPIEFVTLAEECGLIEPLGRVVLAQAARKAAAWRSGGMPVRIAVNVSPIQFKRPHFAETTLGIIRDAGAEPSDIELEITESAAMGDPEHAARELAPLKAAGVRIAIDDFGTGYSNLAALTRLPFDVLKIDRAFVRDAESEAGARAVVSAVLGLAVNLGFETVAEGVETAEQLDFVVSHGCTHAQGYLFGRPMPAAIFEVWYADRLMAQLREMGARGADEAAKDRAVAAGTARGVPRH